jgi:hypothetical protein
MSILKSIIKIKKISLQIMGIQEIQMKTLEILTMEARR